jgi:isoquinoline 1-oxidoreductase beta subunit
MQNQASFSRRDFLRFTGITGTGLLIGLDMACNQAPKMASLSEVTNWYEFAPVLNIANNGIVTIFNTKPEIGQGVWQSIPALVCEELEVPLETVIIKHTGGEKKFGDMQFAGGSFSVRSSYQELRKVGASAKAMLITAAAQQWKVPESECYAADATIFHQPSGKKLSYADVVAVASKLPVPEKPKLKDPKEFKLLGKAVPRPDIPSKINGTALFGIDAKTPGMVYASVEHCPVFGAKMVSMDDSAAKNIKGVIAVVKCIRKIQKYRFEAVAVVADSYWTALQARKALKISWDTQGKEKFNTAAYEEKLRKGALKPGVTDKPIGDFEKAYAGAAVKLEAFYETPMVSHSPIEPMNCLAKWEGNDKLEIWTSTQVPRDVVGTLAKEYNLSEDNITLHNLFSGGGFGRRLYPDYINEAVQIAKAVGKPVKMIWSREDDTQQGPFRPMTFSAMKAGLDTNGKPMAFQHKVISPSLSAADDATFKSTKEDGSMTEGINDQKYEIPNMKNPYVFEELHIPVAAWRAVTSTTLAFAHECFIDEMAVKAGKDPMQYRLDMAKKDSDLFRILTKLKAVSNWDQALPAGKGRGVAQYEFFAGHAGHVVEVSKQGSGIKIDKVYSVIDMGTVVNPDTVKAQVEGAVVMAITAAIKNGISFENGQTKQSNYDTNPILRIHEMPPVEVHILADGGEVIKGAGEPGLPPLAPALCNAIYAATGKRIRKLPFDINNV